MAEPRHRSFLDSKRAAGVLVALLSPRRLSIPEAIRSLQACVVHKRDPKAASWRRAVEILGTQAARRMGMDGPRRDYWVIRLVVHLKRPKSHYGTGRNADVVKASSPLHPISKPDDDNYLKLAKDALEGIFWANDSQVVASTVVKTYSSWQGFEVEISTLES